MVRAAVHARTEPGPHQVSTALVGLLLVLLAVPAGAAARSTVPLAGGAAALAEAAGLRRSPGPARILLEVTRVIYDAPPGEAPGVDTRRARVLTYLAAPATGTADDIPLPLTPDIWRTILGRPVPDGRIALEILGDRLAALLYTGLYALDDETLGWFAAHPQTLAAIYRDHAAIFAAFGRSIRIRNGRVQPPGGSAYDATWERLVGEPLARPDEFLTRLLSRGRGRMAFFYDTMAHLDAPRLQFALSGRPDDLSDAFSRPEEEWRPMRRPFNRTAVDGALLFSALHVDEKGRLLGPPWSELWEDVFARGCASRGRGPARGDRSSAIAKSPPIDAAWLASRIVAPGVGRARERLRLLLFAQRVFPAPPDKAAEDVRDALCGVARAPALMLSLERIGVRDPGLYARAAAVAEQSPGEPHSSDRRPRLVTIQSAIALLTFARQNRAIAADLAATLATGAIDAAGAAKSDAGPMIDWVEKSLVPAFAKTTGLSPDREPIERIVLAAAAGVRSDAVLPPVDWEGMAYRVDPAAARLGDAERVRARQLSASLDVALAAHRAAWGRALAADRDALAALKSASANGPGPDGADETDGVSLGEVVANPTRENSEALFADTLASMVYALSVGSSTTAAARAANIARRHELRSAASGIGPTAAETAWDIPDEEFGPGGWMVRGSLIGLDVGLSRLALRRQLDTGLPPAPDVSDNDRRTLAETVRLMTWGELTDADLRELAAALARGRDRARTLLDQPDGMATLGTEAAMDEVRRQALAWIASRDRAAAFEELWLSELARLGKPGIPASRLDAWGTAALPLEGGLAVRYPASGDACLLAGRPAIGMMAMTVPDIALRVAEVLAELKLPAALMPDAMAFATQLVIDDATTMHADDRDALAIAARRLPVDQMVDVVAALTAAGPLVPRRTP
jgi:hypothetical protein